MQGWDRIIPTDMKAAYINALFGAGFDTIDCGSFVSPKAVPQMADTREVLSKLNYRKSDTRVMVIVGNARGGVQAVGSAGVEILAYPFSVSETFLKRNLNTSPERAWQTVADLRDICRQSGKDMRVYLTMAFGNPYEDPWNDALVLKEIDRLREAGIHNIVLSDTIGAGSPESIERLCEAAMHAHSAIELGVHFHTSDLDWQQRVEAAWRAGFRNFESALGGYGGCPMTGYEMLANLDTHKLVTWCMKKGIETGVSKEALERAREIANTIFV